MQSLIIHGRQPEIGRAELESLYGTGKLQIPSPETTIVDVDPCLLAFDRLGGATKFCKILTTLDTVKWDEIESFLIQVSPGHSGRMAEGKMQLGLSLYGFNESINRIQATGLKLKKAIKQTGRSVRLIPNKKPILNSAQVWHNKLTGPTGWELIFILSGKQTIVAQTVKVQNIEAYARRDQNRPKRDAYVGMLPPKLAQIIINLASGPIAEEKLESICDIPAEQEIPLKILDQTILDPFCGTGVILQEAELMGYGTYGTDLEPRMIDYSKENLAWLHKNFRVAGPICAHCEAGDATNHQWQHKFDFIACETYLGRPLNSPPDSQTLKKIVSDCDTIHKKFLQNLAKQTKPGFRMCIAIPAWKTKNGFVRLPTLETLAKLGYNRVKFVHSSDKDLIYHRPGQVVGRELVVLTRK